MKKYFNLQIIQQKLCNTYQFDIRAFALFRIVFAFVMLLDLCIRLSDFRAFYTHEGILPLTLFQANFGKHLFIPIYQLNDSVWFVGFCFTIHLLCVLLFGIGYKTKLFQVVILLLYISLNMRNPFVINGGDALITCMLFFSLFIPLNSFWALNNKTKTYNYIIPVFVFMVQVLLIYSLSAIKKNSVEWHSEGTALFFAFSIQNATYSWSSYLLNFPNQLKFLTQFVWYFELLIPILFFVPFKNNLFRMAGIFMLIIFNLFILVTLKVGLFNVLNMVTLIPLLPANVFNYFINKKESITSFNLKHNHLVFMPFMALLFVFVYHINNYYKWNKYTTTVFKELAIAVGINQNWGMFAPTVNKVDGYFIFKGITNNNDTINLSANNVKIKNSRWRKYYNHLLLDKSKLLSKQLKQYLICENKNLNIRDLKLYYFLKLNRGVRIQPVYKTLNIEEENLFDNNVIHE